MCFLAENVCAVKWVEGGRFFQNHHEQNNPTKPMQVMAIRQEERSVMTPVAMRPSIPPIALPPIKIPMEAPWYCGCTSSPKYVIAMAGIPARKTPSKARQSKRVAKFGLSALAIVTREVPKSEITMMFFRPQVLDRKAVTVIMTARITVVMEITRLVVTGAT